MVELCKELDYEQILVIDKIPADRNTFYIGDDISVKENINKYSKYHFCITPDSPNVRERLYQQYKNYKLNFPPLISSGAKISESAKIGNGSVIQFGSFISSDTTIGEFVKINVNSCIMHDVIIGNFSSLSPSCTLLGNIKIGNNCYVGSSATILPGISICNDVIVGAGAVVTKPILVPGIYVGVPASRKK